MHVEQMEYLLTEKYAYETPQVGEIRTGILLEIDDHGAVVDIGLKHDGIVPRTDIERLDDKTLSKLVPGQEVTTRIIKAQDREDNLLLSLSYIQEKKDWEKAQAMFTNDQIDSGKVIGYNQGGLLIKFGTITGFIPVSHLWERSAHRALKVKRKGVLSRYMSQELSFKIIEVNEETNRLVMSERLAEQDLREQSREKLIREFEEGQTRSGIVTHLSDFGAFVDLGDIDGLIHISELAWRRIQHPSEIVQVGDEVDVYILDVDHERKRISLSLKQLQKNPWERVEDVYYIGQLVHGTVTNVVNFGAFIALDIGIEGLLHISEIADPTPHDPREFIQRGDQLVVRILRVEGERQRIELSLKDVSESEREMYLAIQAQ